MMDEPRLQTMGPHVSPKWHNKARRSSIPSAPSSPPSHSRESSAPLRTLMRLDRRVQHEPKPGTPDVTLSPPRRGHLRNTWNQQLASPVSEQDTPRFAGLRTFLHKVTPGSSSNAADTTEYQPMRPTRIVMPEARRAAIPMLNSDSPPLSPVLDDENSDGEPDTATYDTASIASVDRPHYVPPRHAWSAAQAAADAASVEKPFSPPPLEPWTAPRVAEPLPFPVLNERVSTPSSLSSARSLSWSRADDENKRAAARGPSRFAAVTHACRAGMLRLWPSAAVRADVEPRAQSQWVATLAPHAWKLVLLGVTFVAATAVLGACLRTLPLHLPTHLAQLTLTEVRDMCAALQTYAQSSTLAMWHVWIVLSLFFTWKQAFCVPGSLITNIVFGAMYGAYAGSFFASLLTAFGGVLCYLLAMPFGEVVSHVPGLAKPLHAMRRALAIVEEPASLQHRDRPPTPRVDAGDPPRNLWNYLLFLRLLPIVPYGMMNIACGVLRVPLLPFAVTLGIGSIPWNFCTAQIGEILQDVVSAIQAERSHLLAAQVSAASPLEASTQATGAAESLLASGVVSVLLARIWTVDMMVKLALLSAASALPVVLHRVYRQRADATEAAAREADAAPACMEMS